MRGKVPVARVAAEAGLEAPTLFRYLGGHRQPTRETVRTIDDVVAYLLHDTGHRIAPYLDSCYGLDHAAELDFVHDDVLHAYSLTTSAALPYLRADALVEINELLKAMPRPKFRRLQAAVNAMFRRQLMPYVAGDREPSKLMFEELADVFRRHDVDLARWLKPKNELEERLHEDLFERESVKLCERFAIRRQEPGLKAPLSALSTNSVVLTSIERAECFPTSKIPLEQRKELKKKNACLPAPVLAVREREKSRKSNRPQGAEEVP